MAATKGWKLRTGGILCGISIFVAVSAWAYMPWWELAFRSDASPVSWLSSALLFACFALAAQIGAQRGLPPLLAGWLVIAMLVMALDEQFMYHEYWKYHCHEWTSLCGRAVAGRAHWLGDAPMALVGIVGVATLVILYRALGSSVVRGLMIAGVTVGVLLALGTHFGHAMGMLPGIVSQLEEVFEVYAEALFMCALIEIRPRRGMPGIAGTSDRLPNTRHQVQSASSS
jgi:hypothetical protein